MVPADTALLSQLVTVLGLSLVTVCLLRRLRIPAVVGYLLVGVAFGPGALGLVGDGEATKAVAEIGLLFLLFTTGLKFSLKDLVQMRRWVFGAGAIQVGVTIGVAIGLGVLLDVGARVGTLFGCLVALSSTSVVAKLLEERGGINAPHGRFGMSLLLFQDLAVVPMVLLMPLLAGTQGTVGAALLSVGKTVAMMAAVLIAARFLYPWILDRVVASRSRELFTLTTVCAALGTAFLVGKAGASLELGAFLAGIVVSETDYGRETLETVAPLRDVFSSLFFVSIGLLVAPSEWYAQPLLMLGIAAGVVLAKAALIGGLGVLFGLSLEAALLAGMGLAQLGEFSFIVARQAIEFELMEAEWYRVFLSVTVLSMAVTPLLMGTAPALASRLQRRHDVPPEPDAALSEASGHVVIVGFGVQGRNVARVLEQIGVPYTVIEMNPVTVREQGARGVPIMFGDAGRESVLRHARIEHARVLVNSVPNPADSRRVVSEARRLNPALYIIARTRYLGDVEALSALGADEVVPEEFETAIEMVGLVMQAYGVPPRAAMREQEHIRQGHYGLLREDTSPRGRGPSLRSLLSGADVEEVTLGPESPAVGQTVRTLDLRAATGVTLLGIERAGEILANPSPDTPLLAGDVLILFGTGEGVTRAADLLTGSHRAG